MILAGLAIVWLAASDGRAQSGRPNILFAIADDWGAHAGAYGTRWVKTPSFDRIAREGILFQHATRRWPNVLHREPSC